MPEATMSKTTNPYLIYPATIVEKTQESADIVSLRLRLEDAGIRKGFRFQAGQFNMLYVFGVGEVAISIVSDPDQPQFLDHTIRVVGRVTNVIGRMEVGESLGIRGPFGQGWPMEHAKGKDVLVVTGGLGCAPVVGAIEYMFRRREVLIRNSTVSFGRPSKISSMIYSFAVCE